MGAGLGASLGASLVGLAFWPSVAHSCRQTRKEMARYNTHTQVWCPILAASLGAKLGDRLASSLGASLGASLGDRLGLQIGLLFPSVSRSWLS